MKKKIMSIVALGMIVSLAACGESGAPASTPEVTPASTSVSVSEVVNNEPVSDPVAPSEESLIDDFREAQNLWYKFESGLESDYEDQISGQINGYDNVFYRVTEPGMGSIQEMTDTLSARIDRAFVEKAISDDQKFKEVDGVLYASPVGRGDDMSICYVDLAAESDGESGKVIVTIHRQDYFDALGDFYETGALDVHEYPFTIVDGHAVFSTMEYLCGPSPMNKPEEGHDADSLEAALIGLLEGKWTFSDGSSYYEINADGTFTYYTGDEVAYSGVIFSSRSDDGSYMMEGQDISNTLFTLGKDDNGMPVLLFDGGASVFTQEGRG